MSTEILYYIGISQSLFVAFVVLTKKDKHASDYILMTWLLTIALKFSILLISAEHSEFFDDQFSIGLIPLTFGPFLYLYTKYLLFKRHFFRSKDFIHFIPFILLTILYFAFFKEKLTFNGPLILKKDGYIPFRLLYAFAFVSSIISYAYMTLKLLAKNRNLLKDRFSYFSENNELNWLYALTAIFLLTYSTYFALGGYNAIKGVQYFDIGYTADIFLTILAFTVSYFGLKQPYLFRYIPEKTEKDDDEENNTPKQKQGEDDDDSTEKYKNSTLTDEQKERYIKHIFAFTESEKPYLNSELTVQDLSKQLNISRHHLTEILNNDIGKNFFTFINEYRIKEVQRRLLDPKFEHLTIVAIAFDSGFNSKSTFNSIFKQQTDTTPSKWRSEQLKNLE
ncbi:MAG: helix-turn-helix transcriptional regulator [Chitinophagales bacterium]|nr:helix-turn-helix transcriptional regulator [Chitinophagales bacterium]